MWSREVDVWLGSFVGFVESSCAGMLEVVRANEEIYDKKREFYAKNEEFC